MKYSTIAFDLDGTLAESKGPLGKKVAEQLCELLKTYNVLVVSGGNYKQFQQQILDHLDCSDSKLLSKLFLMPTTGAQMYRYENNEWICVYKKILPQTIIENLRLHFEQVLEQFPKFFDDRVYGKRFEDRETQVSFSGQGQEAPLEVKSTWDPDQKKRTTIAAYLEPRFPDLNIKAGGTSTIDITYKGIDKAFAVKEFSKIIDVPVKSVLFIGDALYPGGNDEAVKKLNIDTEQVDNNNGTNTTDTEILLDSILDESYQGLSG